MQRLILCYHYSQANALEIDSNMHEYVKIDLLIAWSFDRFNYYFYYKLN